MFKILLVLTLLLFKLTMFGDDVLDVINRDNFGPILKIGITRAMGEKVYFSSDYGDYKIRYKSSGKDVVIKKKMGQIDSVELKENSLYYKDELVTEFWLEKSDIIAILKVSNDGKKYLRYRDEFNLVINDDKIIPINHINAEEYLYSVVPSEIGSRFPDEAIKAQALAARSYLYNSLRVKRYKYCDLLDTVASQVYLGYDRENKKINSLVNLTNNEVIVHNGKPINALFHSTSGGKTADNEDVWGGRSVPYLRSVDDRGNGKISPRQNWSTKVSIKELSRIFGFKVSYIRILSRKNGRATRLQIVGRKKLTLSGNEFRRRLGYTRVHSTLLSIKNKGSYVFINGSGSGHGVGLPQWSAYTLAVEGKNYKDILFKYYKDVEIKNLYELEKE